MDHNQIQKMQHPHASQRRSVIDTDGVQNKADNSFQCSCCKKSEGVKFSSFSIGSRSSSSVIWHVHYCGTEQSKKEEKATTTTEALHISDQINKPWFSVAGNRYFFVVFDNRRVRKKRHIPSVSSKAECNSIYVKFHQKVSCSDTNSSF